MTSKRRQLIVISPLSARLLPLPSPHFTMFEAPSCARGSLMLPGTLLLRNSIEQEPSDLPPHYICDKPSRARCGKFLTWQLSTTSQFSSREEKGLLRRGQADTNGLSLVSQSFLTRGGRRMSGARSRCMQLFMLRPVYSSLSRRTAGIRSS